MMNSFERLMNIRMGGGVERCHTVKYQGSYSVAAHSWGVATIMYVLWPADFPRLAPYCIFHDVPEAWVGDVPAPAKKFNPVVKTSFDEMESRIFARLRLPNDADLSLEDQRKLKACDHLELYLWAREQMGLGNSHARCVAQELTGFFNREPLLPEAAVLYDFIATGSVEHDLCPGYRALFEGT